MPQNDYEKHSQYLPSMKEELIKEALLGELGDDTDFTYGTPGSYEIGYTDEIGATASFDANPPRLVGNIKYNVKGKNLISSSQVYIPATGTSMLLSIKTPLAPIIKALEKASSIPQAAAMLGLEDSDFYEIGWNPFKSIKKGAKKAAKTVGKKIAKKTMQYTVQTAAFKKVAKKTKRAKDVFWDKTKKFHRNPYHQKFAKGVATIVGMYYGIPPKTTMKSVDMVFGVVNGDKVDAKKMEEVALLAAEEYPPAKKAMAVIETIKKADITDMRPYFDEAQKVLGNKYPEESKIIAEARAVAEAEYGKGIPLSKDAITLRMAEELNTRYSPQLKKLEARYEKFDTKDIFPFNIPGMDFGPKISGWLYNVPYRTNLTAKELDVFGKGRNPFHLLRGAYHQGMS